MEGMRQGDELRRMEPDIPGTSAILERLVPTEGIPEGLHPVTAEIFALVEFYPRVDDLVDRAAATDMEVFVALKSLTDAGLLRVLVSPSTETKQEFITPDELLELRSRLRRAGLVPVFLDRPKIALVAADLEDIRFFCNTMTRFADFVADDLESVAHLPLGKLGSLRLGENFCVEFLIVSPDERLLPFAYGLSAGTIAALVFGTGNLDDVESALEFLESERRAPLLLIRRPGEPTLSGDEKRIVLEVDDLSEENVHLILGTLFRQVAGMDLRGARL